MRESAVAKERVVNLYTKDDSDHPLYREVVVWCPGCDQRHSFTIEKIDKEFMDSRHPDWPVWQWDGNIEKPTFSPSLLAFYTIHLCANEHTFTECTKPLSECEHHSHGYAWIFPDGTQRTFKVWESKPEGVREITFGEMSPHPRDPAFGNCHSFLKEGRWEFLSDSAHELAGKTVDMVPFPDHARAYELG